MKEKPKIKLGKLNLYIIDNNYINYLSQFDKHIAHNKDGKRPYIGVVITVNKYYYFAPLFSPKPKHKDYKDNLSYFRIVTKKKKQLGIIRFSDMIPVPEDSVSLIDIKDKNYGYKRLIFDQYSYINQKRNKERIIKKAEKIYKLVTMTKNNKSRTAIFYRELSCNFKFLEEKCLEYNISYRTRR